MAFMHLPPGTPGTLTWKAKQVGIDPYAFARSEGGMPGTTGNQARFYLAMMNHRRMRQAALAAAASGRQAQR